jgi:hypothetical protein
MVKDKISTRQLKRQVLDLLRQPDYGFCIKQICCLPYRQVVNPLFSFLYSLDEQVKWRAVSAMGAVVSRLAESEMEPARIIMRRFMWNLNDESGGIGWGSPEAIGEIMALNPKLADEYARILVSYIKPDGNFLEHAGLQRGVIWGVGRLAHARPQLVADSASFLSPYIKTADSVLRGYALWAASALPIEGTRKAIEELRGDDTKIILYLNGRFLEYKIKSLVEKTLTAKRQ